MGLKPSENQICLPLVDCVPEPTASGVPESDHDGSGVRNSISGLPSSWNAVPWRVGCSPPIALPSSAPDARVDESSSETPAERFWDQQRRMIRLPRQLRKRNVRWSHDGCVVSVSRLQRRHSSDVHSRCSEASLLQLQLLLHGWSDGLEATLKRTSWAV